MTTMREPTTRSTASAAWSAGGVIFAATLMVIGGVFAIFEGIVALAKDPLYVTTPSNYTWRFSLTSWGWIHLIIGAVTALAGLALFTGANWARYFGIVVAGVSLLTNFFFIPYYPFWSLAIMAIDVFIIWALATAPRYAARMEERRMAESGMAESRTGDPRMGTPRRDM